MNNGGTLGKGKRAQGKGSKLGAKIHGAELGAKTCGAEVFAALNGCPDLGATTGGAETCNLGATICGADPRA